MMIYVSKVYGATLTPAPDFQPPSCVAGSACYWRTPLHYPFRSPRPESAPEVEQKQVAWPPRPSLALPTTPPRAHRPPPLPSHISVGGPEGRGSGPCLHGQGPKGPNCSSHKKACPCFKVFKAFGSYLTKDYEGTLQTANSCSCNTKAFACI